MSNVAARPAVRLPAPRRAAPRTASRTVPNLRVVTGSEARRGAGAGFMIICTTLLALGLMALLLLNTARAEQSFALSKLQNNSTSLSDNEAQLRGDISSIAAPQQVALAAQEQGLVQVGQVTYVRASDRKVLGVAGRPATADTFTVGTLPDTPASAVADKAVTASSGAVLIAKPAPAKPTASSSPSASKGSKEPNRSASPSPKSKAASSASSAPAHSSPTKAARSNAPAASATPSAAR